MNIAQDAQDKVTDSLNAEGRSLTHVAVGAAICAALIGVTAAASARKAQPVAPGGKPVRHPIAKAVWPSLFSLTTLAALRVWNAPDSPRRTRALGWWAALQASNLAMTFWRPTRRGGQAVAAVTTAALTAAYAHQAAYVDRKAADMSAPTGFAGLASLVATPARRAA